MALSKNDCIQKWIANNYPVDNRKLFVQLTSSNCGKMILAQAMVEPFVRRIKYIKKELELGKQRLGYKSCIDKLCNDVNKLIEDLELFISIFYKRQYKTNPIKQLIIICNDAKSFKESIESNGRSFKL